MASHTRHCRHTQLPQLRKLLKAGTVSATSLSEYQSSFTVTLQWDRVQARMQAAESPAQAGGSGYESEEEEDGEDGSEWETASEDEVDQASIQATTSADGAKESTRASSSSQASAATGIATAPGELALNPSPLPQELWQGYAALHVISPANHLLLEVHAAFPGPFWGEQLGGMSCKYWSRHCL